jgi:chemosensory pili system protein ChpA (sensor histidine kinase/response regulator)
MRKHSPDIVLSDLEMPKMTGLELTSNIRADKTFANTPVIMITSRASSKHKKQAEKAGVNKYITKPYTEDELIDLLHNFTHNKSAMGQISITH